MDDKLESQPTFEIVPSLIEMPQEKSTRTFEEIHAYYNLQIKDIENTIKRAKNSLLPFEKILRDIEVDIKVLESKYMDLNYEFEKEIDEIENIKFEYKSIMKEEEYLKILQRKERGVRRLIDKILDRERQLLNKEKERLHKLEEMKPRERELTNLEILLESLKNQYQNLLTLELSKRSQSQKEPKSNIMEIPTIELIASK